MSQEPKINDLFNTISLKRTKAIFSYHADKIDFSQIKNDTKENLLHIFALKSYDKKEAFTLALRHGVNPKEQETIFRNTVLHTLIINELETDALDLLDLLIDPKINRSGFDFTAKDIYGRTPLMLAVLTNKPSIVKKFLTISKAYKVDIGLHVADNKNMTPLHYASGLGLYEITELLIPYYSNNLDIKPVNQKFSPLDMTVSDKKFVTSTFKEIGINHERAENALSNNLRDRDNNELRYFKDGKPYLSPSIKKAEGKIFEKTIYDTQLLNVKETVLAGNITPMEREEKQFIIDVYKKLSPKSLLETCLNNQKATQELLLKHKASPNWLLRYYASQGDFDNVERLYNLSLNTLNINEKNLNGKTALHYAIGNKKSIDKVISALSRFNEIDPNIPDNDGNTPLHLAIINKNYPAITSLLKHFNNISIYIKNNKGETAKTLLDSIFLQNNLLETTSENDFASLKLLFQEIENRETVAITLQSHCRRYKEQQSFMFFQERSQNLNEMKKEMESLLKNNQFHALAQRATKAEKYQEDTEQEWNKTYYN